MKKLLIASTALVATTGMAAAEISFGGYGRFGIRYDEGAKAETSLEQRFRLTVTGVAESDNGVKFEGRIRFETNDTGDKASGKGPGPAGFAVTSGGFRLDVGHVSDALDSGDTLNYYGYGVGLTGFLEQNSAFYDGSFVAGGFGAATDGEEKVQKVKLRYSAGDFTVNMSYAPQTNITSDEVFQIGAGYNFGDHSVGLVYGDNQTADYDFWVIGADGSFGDFSYAAIVGEANSEGTSYGLSGNYAISAATSISAIYSGGGASTDDAYGIGVAHSLGGGVTLKGGVGSDTSGNTQADAGVIFSF